MPRSRAAANEHLRLLTEFGYINDATEVTYVVDDRIVRGRRFVLHLAAPGSCYDGDNDAMTAPLGQVRPWLARTKLCWCVSFLRSDLDTRIRAQLTYLSDLAAKEPRTTDRLATLSQVCRAALTEPSHGPDERVNAYCDTRVAQFRRECADVAQSALLRHQTAQRLREGVGRYRQLRQLLASLPGQQHIQYGLGDPLPLPDDLDIDAASDDEVISVLGNSRCWAFAYPSDHLGPRLLGFADPFTQGYALLGDGVVLLRVPVAAAVAGGLSVADVVGLDEGFTPEEVRTATRLLVPGVDLADAVNALRGARV